MSYGLAAALMVKLEANLGNWVPAASLASELHVPESAVSSTLKTLHAAQMVVVQCHSSGEVGLARALRSGLVAQQEAAP